MKKPRILVTVSSDISTDNRVLKTCTTMDSMGLAVFLVGRRKKNSIGLPTHNFHIKRIKLIFEKGPLFYFFLNFRLFFILLFAKIDGIYVNDLDTLMPGYLVSRLKRIPLIYDTHEIFTEVPELTDRKLKKRIWEWIEKRIFNKLNTIITVNLSIANYYENKYGKKVVVIRNIPSRFKTASQNQSEEKNQQFKIIIQGSGLNIDRGIEEAVLAMKEIDNAQLWLVGDGDVIPKIKDILSIEGLSKKVKIIGRLPYNEMMKFTVESDIGLSLDKPTSLNYIYSLPNKIFDYIHANTPVVSSDLVEIRKIIEQYQCGVLIDEVNPHSIATAINEIRLNASLLKRLKANCEKASTEENWEEESKKLEAIIREAYGF